VKQIILFPREVYILSQYLPVAVISSYWT